MALAGHQQQGDPHGGGPGGGDAGGDRQPIARVGPFAVLDERGVLVGGDVTDDLPVGLPGRGGVALPVRDAVGHHAEQGAADPQRDAAGDAQALRGGAVGGQRGRRGGRWRGGRWCGCDDRWRRLGRRLGYRLDRRRWSGLTRVGRERGESARDLGESLRTVGDLRQRRGLRVGRPERGDMRVQQGLQVAQRPDGAALLVLDQQHPAHRRQHLLAVVPIAAGIGHGGIGGLKFDEGLGVAAGLVVIHRLVVMTGGRGRHEREDEGEHGDHGRVRSGRAWVSGDGVPGGKVRSPSASARQSVSGLCGRPTSDTACGEPFGSTSTRRVRRRRAGS